MDGIMRNVLRWRLLALILIMVPTAGCIGLAAQALYVLKGHKTPAQFDGFKNKRVAIVCVSDQDAIGSDLMTHRVCQLLSVQLAQNVKGIEIVPQSDITELLKSNSWERVDFAEVGRHVNADYVLAVELSSYSLDEGSTMYKGRAETTTSVYDMKKNGTLVFTKGPEDFSFPRDGRPKMQSKRREFENAYLSRLTTYLAQYFFKHDTLERVEKDSSF